MFVCILNLKIGPQGWNPNICMRQEPIRQPLLGFQLWGQRKKERKVYQKQWPTKVFFVIFIFPSLNTDLKQTRIKLWLCLLDYVCLPQCEVDQQAFSVMVWQGFSFSFFSCRDILPRVIRMHSEECEILPKVVMLSRWCSSCSCSCGAETRIFACPAWHSMLRRSSFPGYHRLQNFYSKLLSWPAIAAVGSSEH